MIFFPVSIRCLIESSLLHYPGNFPLKISPVATHFDTNSEASFSPYMKIGVSTNFDNLINLSKYSFFLVSPFAENFSAQILNRISGFTCIRDYLHALINRKAESERILSSL